jgi:hypothetical protein
LYIPVFILEKVFGRDLVGTTLTDSDSHGVPTIKESEFLFILSPLEV